jgi:hypothetical protein
MNRRGILMMVAATLPGFVLLPGSALSQQKSLKEQLVGTWTFVSSSGKRPDGSPTWGSNAKGLLIFTENGRFSTQIVRSDRPKYASGSRLKGTPEEHKATAEGTISNFGTYSVDEANKTVTLRFEASSFPNSEGTEQTRAFSVAGDELKYTNPAPTIGGPPTELVWRRAK